MAKHLKCSAVKLPVNIEFMAFKKYSNVFGSNESDFKASSHFLMIPSVRCQY